MIASGTPIAAESWRTWLLYRSPMGLNAHAESPNSVVYPISDSVLLPVPTTRPRQVTDRSYRTAIRIRAMRLPRRSGAASSASGPPSPGTPSRPK